MEKYFIIYDCLTLRKENKNLMNKKQSFLLISGHDYRSKRKANVHFIMQELAKLGQARFFSVGFSQLSKIKKDPRISLWDQSNAVASHEGVECYLWRTMLHPINLQRFGLSILENLWFKIYERQTPKILDRWIKEATTIIIESGMGILFFKRIKRLNPYAKIIYRASDTLETIGCSAVLQKELKLCAPDFDKIAVVSPKMSGEFPDNLRITVTQHGLDAQVLECDAPSPYPATGVHLVSVGSMLFDASFFEIASPALPDINFHIIGAGQGVEVLRVLPNVIIYDEMPFEETLPFLKYAHAGIAPYNGDKAAPYLVDTSLKLMQFAAFGLPAVCPQITAGKHENRFGYISKDKASITTAVQSALNYGRFDATLPPKWGDISDIILHTSEHLS